jgi:lysophospholipase L1-like esterase
MERLQFLRWPTAMSWLQTFNETIRSLAAAHDIPLADIHAHFLGHSLLVGNPTEAFARPENRDLWLCGTIEPNAWGASAIRELWWQRLKATGLVTEPSEVG